MYQIRKKSDYQRHEEIQFLVQTLKNDDKEPEYILKKVFHLTGIAVSDIIMHFDIGEIPEPKNHIKSLELRNYSIREIYDLYLDAGLRSSNIYMRLSYITGLSPDYLKQLRFNHQLA